jgi:ABC-2 type transport system permease protein
MRTMLITASQEIRTLRREKLPQALLVVFIGMVSVASLIGWLTKRNVTGIWQKIRAADFTSASNPFAHVPPMYYLRNTVIYIVLIGALLAIVLGVTSIIRDRKAGTSDLIFTRPVGVTAYLSGKILGVVAWLGIVLAFVALISWISLSFITGNPLAIPDSGRLIGFFGLSLLFLSGFVLLGAISAIYSARETSALLLPIALWSVITFVLPQLGTADHPVSLLNPVPALAAQGGAFPLINKIVGPLSVTEQFKNASGWVLGSQDFTGSPQPSLTVLFLAILVGFIVLVRSNRGRLRRTLHD